MSSEIIAIRKAEEKDIVPLTESGEVFIRETGLGQIVEFDLDSWFTTMKRIVEDGERELMIMAEIDGTVVGVISMMFTAAPWNLHKPYCHEMHLFVGKEARGKGVAKALFSAMAEEAVERGCSHIIATSQDASGGDAIGAIYRSAGLEPFERSWYGRI